MELIIERLDLAPQLVGQFGKIIGGHVIARPPHRADILITQLDRAFVGYVHQLGIVIPHRRADVGVPAFPHFGQFSRVPVGAHFGFNIIADDGLAFQRALPFTVGRIEPRRNIVEGFCRAFSCGCWQGEPAA